MFRKFAGVALMVVLVSGVALAKEYQGRLKNIDTDAKKITITGKDKNDQTVSYDDKTEFVGPKGNKFTSKEFDGFVKRFQEAKEKFKEKGKDKGKKDKGAGRRGRGGFQAIITTNDKDVATKVTFKGGRGGKGKPPKVKKEND